MLTLLTILTLLAPALVAVPAYALVPRLLSHLARRAEGPGFARRAELPRATELGRARPAREPMRPAA